MTLTGYFLASTAHELRIACQRWSDLLSPLVFFVIVTTLFPLALAPRQETLQLIGPAVLWIAALLATLLSLNALFRADLEDGTLEQLALGRYPLTVAVLAKIFAHWLLNGIPLILLAPVLSVSYFLSGASVTALCWTLLLGTPTLSLIGATGAALTASVRQGSGLLAILVLPLMLPVLMFGARATALAADGEPISGPLWLLAAMLVLAFTLLPFAAAAAVRISLD